MEIRRYSHFSGSSFRPCCNGEVSVLRDAAPFSDLLVCCERIRGVFFELFGGQLFHLVCEIIRNGAPTRSCTELTRLPSERITENALGALENGVPDRLRSGDLLHERQACCLDYTTGTNGEGRRVRAFDLMHVTHPLC
jgi:hypothetical protein